MPKKARFQLPDGKVAIFEVPDEMGATQSAAQDFDPALPNRNATMQQIAQREDPLGASVQASYAGGVPANLARRLVPGMNLMDVARQAAVPFQRAEAAVAAPALEAQAGNFDPRALGRAAMQGFTGQSQAQAGDLIRTTGVGGKYNEQLAGAYGLATTAPIAFPGIKPATKAAGVAADVTAATAKGAKNVVGTPIEFLKGNKKAIEAAERKLDEVATKTVQRVRNRGDLQARVFEAMSSESNKAWAPMEDVASSIQGKIDVKDVKALAPKRLADKPERLEMLNNFLDNLTTKKGGILPRSKRVFTGSASDWTDLSSEVGTYIGRGAHKGTASRTLKDVLLSDVRNVVADTIEAKAPLEMKGFVTEAKLNWADYAADRNRLFQLFAPGSSPNYSTSSGVKFLKRAAQGRLNADESMFLDRMKATSGLDLPKAVQPFAEAALKARATGAAGKAVSREAKRWAPWMVGGGAALEALRR